MKLLTDNKLRDFPKKSAAEGLESMDKAGIDTSICSIIGPGIWFGHVAETRKLARECNEYAARLVADYPGRFGIFTVLPLPDIDGSLKEIEYGFEKLKADGVYLFTDFGDKPLYGDKYLGDPALGPIYEELNRRKALVYTHPKDNACCRNILPGVGDPTIEYGTDTTRGIASLLFSGTASKYPDVRFIFSHAGGTMPYSIERFIGGSAAYLEEGGVLRPGAPAPRTRPTMPKGPLYELQKFYYDTANALNPLALGALRKMVPISQILFGTDFPFANAAEDRKLLTASGVFATRKSLWRSITRIRCGCCRGIALKAVLASGVGSLHGRHVPAKRKERPKARQAENGAAKIPHRRAIATSSGRRVQLRAYLACPSAARVRRQRRGQWRPSRWHSGST